MKDSEKLIQTIREKNIQPVPKHFFTLKNAAAWLGFLLAVLLGALAFSVVLFCIQQTDFNLFSHLGHSRLEFFLGLLPVFWILFLMLALVLAMVSIRKTGKGYKFSITRLAAFTTAFSILAGTLLFIAGGGRALEHAFELNVNLYESVQEKKVKLWSQPEQGYLSGTILSSDATSILIEDFSNQQWEMHYDSAFVAPVLTLEKGQKIKAIGKMLGKGQFEAREIRPWGGMGLRQKNSSLHLPGDQFIVPALRPAPLSGAPSCRAAHPYRSTWAPQP
ncbi:MAG: hypothetical protein IPL65_00745 [Lewinellaceae bacterium]|nr:hypothetical protein [Lewinellaceae bacterium]